MLLSLGQGGRRKAKSVPPATLFYWSFTVPFPPYYPAVVQHGRARITAVQSCHTTCHLRVLVVARMSYSSTTCIVMDGRGNSRQDPLTDEIRDNSMLR